MKHPSKMPTSASDRFERLFANKPRPVKPVTAEPKDTSHQDTTCDSATSIGAASGDDIHAHKVTVQATAEDAQLNSDDEDEYASLFSKKPMMRDDSAKAKYRPRPATSSTYEAAEMSAVGDVEFIPEGKLSTAQKGHAMKTKDADENLAINYTGNGHPLVGQFCLFSLLAKFPYKYMRDPEDKVSRHFFAENKFYNREWHLYYLHSPRSFDKGALLLVPLAQVQTLLDAISSKFKIEAKVPSFPFTLDFFDDNTPQPILLGISMSKQDANSLTEKIPDVQPGFGECPLVATADLSVAYEVFHDKVEAALLASKGKSKKGTQKKAKKILDSLKESRNQMNRAERYLGLRPRTVPLKATSGLSWEEEQTHKKDQRETCGLLFSFLDVSKPVQYTFEYEPVIISIDIESYERNHGFITEIGVSTLDTMDLVDMPPGTAGENWVRQIRSRHFRIKGREHLVNRDFCIGHPDAFQFGESEFVTLDEVSDAVDRCFEWPFSAQFKKKSHGRSNPNATEDNSTMTIDPIEYQKGPKDRLLVLVGHDIGMDLEYLNRLGSEIFGSHFIGTTKISETPLQRPTSSRHRVLTSILETLDTASIYKMWHMELQTRNLGSICTSLGMDPWFLHNAGNDARYTLEALIKMLIQARLDEDRMQRERDASSTGVVTDEWEAERMRLIDERVETARQKIERKVVGQSPQVPPNEEEGSDIDWSLPLRGEKSARKKSTPKRREEDENQMRADEQVRQRLEAQAAAAADATWYDANESQPPEGW